MAKSLSDHGWSFDLPKRESTKKGRGDVRSLLGYAGESLVIGRALAAGFILFFKAWRDAPYDAVLDHNGRLYRIEIKQTRHGDKISVTGGGRSGEQIDSAAASREKIVSAAHCDVLIGVHSMSGRCWIIPVEVIEILKRTTLSTYGLKNFEEAWGLFIIAERYLGEDGMRARLREWKLEDLKKLREELGIPGNPPNGHQVSIRKWDDISGYLDRRAFEIWQYLAEKATST